MALNSNIWFKLFASCKIVTGQSRSIIYDLERASFYDFPNDFLEIIEMSKVNDIATIKRNYNNEQDSIIEHFFSQFIDSEVGFYTTEPECFPEIDFTWDCPYEVTNAIIELENLMQYDFEEVIAQLDKLGCQAIQIRILSWLSNEELKRIVDVFKDLRIQNVELLIPYQNLTEYTDFYNLLEDEPRLKRILIYSAPADQPISHENYRFDKSIIQFKKDIRSDANEILKAERFVTNIQIFSEAQNHNLGLNRKICINKNGEIKNYINHDISFGNVQTHKIENIIRDDTFKEKWLISNDLIEICNTCQYRYACVSNSDIKKIDNKYYKTDRCNFEVSTNKWKDQQC